MKHLSIVLVVLLSALLFAVSSCNKEERKLKKIKRSIERQWIWNGVKQEGTAAYYYTDTLMPVSSEKEDKIVLMGKIFTFSGQDKETETLSYSGDNAYDVDIVVYYYDNDSIVYRYRESAIHSSTTIVLSSKW